MHNARIESSPRLQKLLSVLEDGAWHTTLDLAIKASTVCASTGISELRANGISIETRIARQQHSVWEYRLLPDAPPPNSLQPKPLNTSPVA